MGDIQRLQPLMMIITTAGNDPSGICYEEYKRAKALADPNATEFSLNEHVVIHEAREDREWDDPLGWEEANPSLLEGLGSTAVLKAKCDEAKMSTSKRRYFIRTACNRWVGDAEESYLDSNGWDECGSLGDLPGRPFTPRIRVALRDPEMLLPTHHQTYCAGALDLSSKIDLSSLCLAFEEGDRVDLKWWFWMPEDNLAFRESQDKIPYRDWVEEGWVQATPGNIIDYAFIRRTITGVMLDEDGGALPYKWEKCLTNRYNIGEIAFDPWGADKLVPELQDYDGMSMVEFRQGYRSMSQPCKNFQALVLDGRVGHGNNPVASWMSRNAVVDMDPAGNIKLNKKKSRTRIDGIVAAVMATELLLNGEGAQARPYSGEGTGMWD